MSNKTNSKRKSSPLQDKVSSHGISDFEDQICQLIGTNVREQFECEMEDELIQDIAHEFAKLEQTGGH